MSELPWHPENDTLNTGIFIGDSNLFRSSASRRYLFGLSAFVGQPLCVVPSILEPRELPGQICRSCSPSQELQDLTSISNESNVGINRAHAECLAKVNKEVKFWLDRWIAKEAIVVMNPQDAWELSVRRFELRRYCHPNNDREIEPHDLSIVSECVAVGAEFIATHNFQSIDHARLNEWSRLSMGQNHNLIGGASDLSNLFINSVTNELRVIGAMTASHEERTYPEESVSIVRFIERLFESNYARLADETKLSWERTTRSERVSLLNDARELSKTPPFVRARLMNEELFAIAQNARVEWVNTARDFGLTFHGKTDV